MCRTLITLVSRKTGCFFSIKCDMMPSYGWKVNLKVWDDEQGWEWLRCAPSDLWRTMLITTKPVKSKHSEPTESREEKKSGCTPRVPHLAYSCSAGVPHLAYSCNARVPHLAYSCNAGVPCLPYSCNAGVPHLAYSCNAGVPCLYPYTKGATYLDFSKPLSLEFFHCKSHPWDWFLFVCVCFYINIHKNNKN